MVERNDVQDVEHLALVLVQALDLYIKDRVHVDLDAVVLLDIVRQTLLVVALDLAQLGEQRLVLAVVGEHLQLGRVLAVALADLALDQGSQLRVSLAQPAAVRNAVGNIAELGRVDLVEIVEYAVLEDLGVQRGYAVDRERARDRQMRHAHGVVRNDGELGDLLEVVREVVPQLAAEALVDLIDDLHDAGHQLLHQRYRPALERLGHDRVVGVSDRLAGDVPRLLPAHVVLVHQDAHELGDDQGRVGVVDVQHMLVREVFERAVLGLVLGADVLDRGGHEEVLLLEAQGLALAVVILRIQHHGDGLRHGVLFERLEVLAGREQLHVQRDRALGFPQAQACDVVGVIARDRHIVRHREHGRIILVLDDQLAVFIKVGVDRAADLDLAGVVHGRDVPYVARSEPGIRQLDLLAVFDLLLENAVLVADGVAGAAHARGGHAVHVAGRQTAEAAVAEAGVGLFLEDVRHLVAHVFQGCGQLGQDAEVIGVVAQAAADKKFHAQIVHLPLPVFFDVVLGFDHVLGECVAHDERAGLINLLLGSVLDLTAEVALQLACNRFLQGVFCVLFVWHGISCLLT